MSATRKAFCSQIWCDALSDLPAAGQFVGQIAWVNVSPVVIYRWNGSNWIGVTPFFGFAGGAIHPESLNPLFDLDANAESYADNDAVGTAHDVSSNGNDFTQATAAKKPTFKTNILNGKSVYRFDGGDCLQRASVPISTFTAIVVFRATGAAGMLYEQSATVDANPGSYFYTDGGGGAIGVNRGGNKSGRVLGTTWGVEDHWAIVVQRYSGNHETHTAWFNGTSWIWAQGALGGADGGTGTVTDTVNIGARDDASSLGHTGDIARIIIYTPHLSVSDIQGVVSYLRVVYDL